MAVWEPGKAVVIFLLMMGLAQTSGGYVGTSDSTIFYFGYTHDDVSNAGEPDRMVDVDVSLLRSIACGSETTVFLFENNTVISNGRAPNLWKFGATYPEISAVSSSIVNAVLYSLASNGSLYAKGYNFNYILSDDTVYNITEPKISPPRLNEDIRYCTSSSCLAFSHFPPGSITDEPVIHEPNVPLYKFVGAWGDLQFGHLGIDPPPPKPTPGMLYEGPDLIVKKVRITVYVSVFILHNDTVLVSGLGRYDPPTNGSPYTYQPIVYNSSINASEVKIVDASVSTYHTLLLSEDHRLFFFGVNTYFASGIPSVERYATVNPIREVPFDGFLSPDDYIVQISAQFTRSSVITKMGYVYIWGTQRYSGTTILDVQYLPKLESTFLRDRYAVRYLNLDDITKSRYEASASCVLTRPRAGNCTGDPPSADYYCIGGLWTTRGGGSTIETITVSSPIEIDGDLTISGPLVINQQSSISVTQCLSTGSIEIVKQQGDDSPSQDIIMTGKNCPDLSGTTVNVISTGHPQKCEKKTATLAKTETGGRMIYSAIFSVNDNDCNHSNRWWIILVSVLGGVVLILIIAILVALPMWRKKHSLEAI